MPARIVDSEYKLNSKFTIQHNASTAQRILNFLVRDISEKHMVTVETHFFRHHPYPKYILLYPKDAEINKKFPKACKSQFKE